MTLPFWAEWTVAALLVVAGLVTLIGTIGLWRFDNFYSRMHGPTMGSSLGLGLVMLASILAFSLSEHRLVLHAVLAAVFLTLTIPITTMMLARAALYRHRREGKHVPAQHRPFDDDANEICPTHDEAS
ncbi:monovalent cation/H(+) antiporter subunit G [Pigmentiphaga litoralis]|uniref:monovalent cation/H(+) antiporter subunit G n=1 Tax=Pigmentiphaga litoralis TaxID=516702 RepID=UPI001E5B0A6D|nr:monovalent cation/H(+) antiporter subunit G [Pigmentiphaga litoralis]